MVAIYGRYVEIGRVALVTRGRYRGKLAAIVNVIDQQHVLVDGPTTGVRRHKINLKSLQLTKIVLKKCRYNQRTGKVTKLWQDQKVDDTWRTSTWAKKLAARKIRSGMSDFDRFKLAKAKQARNRIIRKEMVALKKADKKK